MVNETLEQETLEAAEDVEVPTDGFDPAEAPEDVPRLSRYKSSLELATVPLFPLKSNTKYDLAHSLITAPLAANLLAITPLECVVGVAVL